MPASVEIVPLVFDGPYRSYRVGTPRQRISRTNPNRFKIYTPKKPNTVKPEGNRVIAEIWEKKTTENKSSRRARSEARRKWR
jgi:hypothetical protein